AVVCHANHGTVVAALLEGKPLVMLPSQLEQAMTARRVIKLGAGVTPGARLDAASMGKCLDVVQAGSLAQTGAANLAARSHGQRTQSPHQEIVRRLGGLLGERLH